MRVLRAAGVGAAVFISAATSPGQSPDRPSASTPAARFGRIQAVEPASSIQPAALLVRSQAPPVGAQPTFGAPGFFPSWPVATQQNPMVGGAPMGGMPPMGGTFTNPAQPSTGPSVTEMRGHGGPAATLSVPHAGGPVTWAPGAPNCPTCGPQGHGAALFPGSPPSVLPSDAYISPNMDAPLLGAAVGSPFGLLSTPNRFQANGDVLLWWVQSFQVPALLTTSSVASAGILGRPDTRVLFGNDNVGNSFSVGGRFGGTYWLGERQVWGIDGDVWFLGRNGQTFTYNSAAEGVLARPFFNVNQGIPFSELVAAPGLATGSASILTETVMWGAQANLRRYLASTCRSRVDVFGGFRFMTLSDELKITESFARVPGSDLNQGVPNALSGTVVDRFRTENDFYGAQIGFAGETRWGRWFAEGRASVAMGTVHQTLQVEGNQSIQFTDRSAQITGGLLALPGANIGTFSQDKFGVLPEVTLRLGCYVTPHLRLAVGYNFMYLNSVLRPGDQIDPGLNVNRIPNFPLPGNPQTAFGRPMVPMRDTGITAQGISLSVQYQW